MRLWLRQIRLTKMVGQASSLSVFRVTNADRQDARSTSSAPLFHKGMIPHFLAGNFFSLQLQPK